MKKILSLMLVFFTLCVSLQSCGLIKEFKKVGEKVSVVKTGVDSVLVIAPYSGKLGKFFSEGELSFKQGTLRFVKNEKADSVYIYAYGKISSIVFGWHDMRYRWHEEGFVGSMIGVRFIGRHLKFKRKEATRWKS